MLSYMIGLYLCCVPFAIPIATFSLDPDLSAFKCPHLYGIHMNISFVRPTNEAFGEEPSSCASKKYGSAMEENSAMEGGRRRRKIKRHPSHLMKNLTKKPIYIHPMIMKGFFFVSLYSS